MKRRQSKYSSYFELTGERAICTICQESVAFNSRIGTNCVRSHLKSKHPDKFAEFESHTEAEAKIIKEEDIEETSLWSFINFPLIAKQIVEAPKAADAWEGECSKSQGECDRALMQMIAVDSLPMSFVENEGFLNLLKKLNPNYRPRSRTFYANSGLDDLVQELRAKIKDEVSAAQSLSLTTDSWSSKDHRNHLSAVTAHWIDLNTFTPKYCVLACSSILGRHTSNNLSGSLLEHGLSSFGIDWGRVKAITRDGARTIEGLGRVLGFDDIPCLDHSLQLTVKEIVYSRTEINDLIERMKKWVRKLHKNTVAKAEFKDLLENANLPEQALVKSTETRWSSTQAMMQCFLAAQRALQLWQINNPLERLPTFSDIDWKSIAAVAEVLQPFSEAANLLQHRIYSPASVVLPCIRLLDFKLGQIAISHCGLQAELASGLQRSLATRSAQYTNNSILKTATFLDPRFKDSYFTSSFKSDIIANIRQNTPNNDEDILQQSLIDECEGNHGIYGEFLRATRLPTPSTSSERDAIEEEVSSYLSIPPSASLDPYDFWRYDFMHPSLKKMAVDYLAIPSTSAEAERLLSMFGFVCTKKRDRLNASIVDKLAFCNLNCKIYGLD